MAWKFEIRDGQELDVIDDSGTVVKTIQNDGTGFTFPDVILDVMYQEALNEYQNNNGMTLRALKILADAAFEQIEEV